MLFEASGRLPLAEFRERLQIAARTKHDESRRYWRWAATPPIVLTGAILLSVFWFEARLGSSDVAHPNLDVFLTGSTFAPSPDKVRVCRMSQRGNNPS